MSKFSEECEEKLSSCDKRLQRLCYKAHEVFPFKVIEGYRGQEMQDKLFAEGKSKLKYPNSKHNKSPSQAIDIAPDPIDWNDEARFRLLAGVMFAKADSLGIKLRWGGAWAGLHKMSENKFNDLAHFELVE